MKRTALKRKTPLIAKTWMKTKSSKPKPKKTARMKKMEMKKLIIQQWELPNLPCSRYGEAKSFTRHELFKGMLWHVFSRYIRLRDAGKCISCGQYKTYSELQAGHFAAAGGSDIELCFDEKNVNGECSTCNADFDGWHLVPMKTNLIAKYGMNAVEQIEQIKGMKRSIKWEEEEFVQRIHHYYAKVKEMEK